MTGTASISWQTPVWAEPTSEDAEELDEPPESTSSPQNFCRAPISRPSEQTSLLTKAIKGLSDDDNEEPYHHHEAYNRRRSMASNISIASTADLTSDTGFTSPARTNTPSPPIPNIPVSRFDSVMLTPKAKLQSLLGRVVGEVKAQDPLSREGPKEARPEAPRKRSIQFACGVNSLTPQAPRPPLAKQASEQEVPRRPCIKFACQARPTSTQNTPPRQTSNGTTNRPTTPKKVSAVSTTSPSTPRQFSGRKMSAKHAKFLRASSTDLRNDAAHFHEFACDATREDDWIRQDNRAVTYKLTIDDTLTKENHIRRLAKEAEEEAELEEEDDDDGDDDDFDEEDEDDDDTDSDDEDLGGLSDGYHTDEETGFAESDESEAEEENGNMVLWTLSKSPTMRPNTSVPIIQRRPSLQGGHNSDSSTTTRSSPRRSKMQRIKPIVEAPDLPDSTDFVCGTLDEDRPLEEAYLSCMAARRSEKLRIIPQDIDPSFPASEPEDEDDEEIYNPVHRDSDDDFELPGEMEDLHHGQDRSRRRRKSDNASPKKYHSPPPKQRLHSPPPKPKRHHSPPPKRHYSPPPKSRVGRSPKPLFGGHSPHNIVFPGPKCNTTPMGSPKTGNHVKFNLAARPGATTTKSLPRPGAMFRKPCRSNKSDYEDDLHIRGAIDIVKGLERKRQRRKEKFYQKYCDRARRGQIPERKPQPGRGAERMKELGLLMAGKKDQGNYVLSI